MAAVTLPLSCKISSSPLNWRNASKRCLNICMIFPHEHSVFRHSPDTLSNLIQIYLLLRSSSFWRLKHPTCEYAPAEHFSKLSSPHVWFCAIGSSINNLSRRMMSDSVMKFILYCGKKLFCNRTVHIIVSTALGVNVRDF